MPTSDQEIYRLLLEDTLTGFWDWNIRDSRGYVNSTFKKMLGYAEDELADIQQAWQALLHPEDIQLVLEAYSQLVSSKGKMTFSFETRLFHRNGEMLWVQSSGRAIEWDEKGEVLRVVGSLRDITQQKNYEHQLQTSERRFKGAFQYSAIGMALVSISGRWMEMNDILCKMVGYSRQELLNMTFQNLTHPEDLGSDLGNLQRLLEGIVESYQMEKRYLHKKGHVVWVLLSVSLVRDIENQPLYFVSQIEDITSRKTAEDNLQRSLKLVRQQNERLLNFAHIVSHNLRSHAANMEMMLGLIKKEQNEAEKKFLLESMDDITSSFKSTLDHLTEVVLIQTGREVKVEVLNLKKYLQKAINALNAELRKTHSRIDLRVDEGTQVYFNSAYLDSILLNLISNALKYRHPDRNPEVQISAKQVEESLLKVEIKDNGLGIDLKKHGEKLFGMYKTFHKNKNARGIGLFITKSQVEALGGRIEVKSVLGKGTTFKLLLPIKEVS